MARDIRSFLWSVGLEHAMGPLREQGFATLADCAGLREATAAAAGLMQDERARLLTACRRVRGGGFDTSAPLDQRARQLRAVSAERRRRAHQEREEALAVNSPRGVGGSALGLGSGDPTANTPGGDWLMSLRGDKDTGKGHEKGREG